MFTACTAIEYEPVAEHETFYAFALRNGDGAFAAFAEVEGYAKHREIPVVPVLFRGRFRSVAEISAFMKQAHVEPSALGGEREGVVMRLARGFAATEFQDNVCKSVRPGHMCRATSTGLGSGGRAGSRGGPSKAVRRSCEPKLPNRHMASVMEQDRP